MKLIPLNMKNSLYERLRVLLIGLVATTLILSTACNNTAKKQDLGIPEASDLEPREDLIPELSGYPIPTSYDITKHIYQSGAPYIVSLSNPPEKASEYITQRDKVLNLGVYAADLCYATTYMMKQSTMNYLEASKILIDDLGISTTFNVTYAERIENNIQNRDSLIAVVTESFDDTWNYLVENQQDVLARLVVCGSWIEGIYITTNMAAKAIDNTTFLEALAKQKNSLNKLVELLEPVKDVEEVSDIYNSLSDIGEFYEEVGDIMTDEQLKVLTEKIDVLRESIV
jgi:hypothetical protein